MFEEKYEYRGWKNCLKLSNDEIDLIVTSDTGPRIIRLGFTGKPNVFLEIDDDMGKSGGNTWRLYGGTRLWHAPESLPRTYFPDNKPVGYRWLEGVLELIQDKEETTGMQKEIKIKIDEKQNRIDVKYRIYNRNLWPVKFSVWALSVLQKNGTIVIPQAPYQSHTENLLPAGPIVLWAYTDMSDKRWKWGKKYIQLKQDPSMKSPQKIGLLNKSGWAAYFYGGYLFIKVFKFHEGTEYPDFGSNMEVYTDKDIIEFETLGPLKETMPGNFLEHDETWYLFKADIEPDEESLEKKLTQILKNIQVI